MTSIRIGIIKFLFQFHLVYFYFKFAFTIIHNFQYFPDVSHFTRWSQPFIKLSEINAIKSQKIFRDYSSKSVVHMCRRYFNAAAPTDPMPWSFICSLAGRPIEFNAEPNKTLYLHTSMRRRSSRLTKDRVQLASVDSVRSPSTTQSLLRMQALALQDSFIHDDHWGLRLTHIHMRVYRSLTRSIVSVFCPVHCGHSGVCRQCV